VKTDACPAEFICFTISNAAKIAGRDNILKTWIREAKARCSNPLDAGPDAT
jgi:hypothetical protein